MLPLTDNRPILSFGYEDELGLQCYNFPDEKNSTTRFRRSSEKTDLMTDELSRSTEAFPRIIKTVNVKSNISFMPNLIN